MANKSLTVPYSFEPRWYQLPLFNALDGIEGQPNTKKRRALLVWHRRAGKDLACFCYLAKEAVRKKGVYYYFFPNYEQGRKALWENVHNGFKTLDHLPSNLIASINNQSMIMRLKNGSIIRVVGTDNIDTVRGTNPIGCVFSEYAYQDPRGWEAIRPILRENKGWAIFNSTPDGQNHFYKMYMNVKNDPSWFVSVLSVNDTGSVTEKEIAQERKEGMDENMIQQEYFVSFTSATRGAIYADQLDLAYQQGRVGEFIPDPAMWVDTFWDLGVDDSTAIWFRQNVGNKLIFIDYFEANGKDFSYYIEVLKNKGYKFRTHYFPHDGANRNIITTLKPCEAFSELCKNAGISYEVVVTPKFAKKQHGIMAVRKRFGRFFFNEGLCEEGLERLKLYHRRYDRKREAYIDEPVHDWTSHCADALMTEASAEELDYANDYTGYDKITVKNKYNLF